MAVDVDNVRIELQLSASVISDDDIDYVTRVAWDIGFDEFEAIAEGQPPFIFSPQSHSL
jgi:hypothetical protein